jgi:serine/threonine protein kinase
MSLKSEISLLKKLSHKNIVKYKFTEIHEDMTAVDIVLEYIPGGSLRNLLNKITRLEE